MEENPDKIMNRREFLRLGAVGALTFLAEIGLPKDALAQLEKLLAGRKFISEDFTEGMDLLRKKVFDDKEHFWVYLEKGDKRGWIDGAEKASKNTIHAIDLTPLFRDKEISKANFVHTHPPSERTKKIGSTIFPPSSIDVMTAAYFKASSEFSGAKGREIAFSILDPSGVWNYDVDIEHGNIKPTLIQYFEVKDASPPPQMTNDLLEWQEKFDTGKGAEIKNLKEFCEFMEKEYGVKLSYEFEM